MNTPDQDTLFRAVMDARSILSEQDVGSAQALERLWAVLDASLFRPISSSPRAWQTGDPVCCRYLRI